MRRSSAVHSVNEEPDRREVQLSFSWVFRRNQTGMQMNNGGEIAQRLERERTDRKVRGSNPASASRLPLPRLGQPGSIPALVLPSGGMAARHRKGATAERFFNTQNYHVLANCRPLLR
ncbi:hypothetical protein CSKR_110464 [Clonorchis sinensis]|uniref:Uncharacterized protein n=1 Tax=Clonorchis sinensis TaxID=79923 RepID=A0A3R7H744_CLOSI|nr:hypothetical protein CSKR_110464 [Clonorchis sinensis]